MQDAYGSRAPSRRGACRLAGRPIVGAGRGRDKVRRSGHLARRGIKKGSLARIGRLPSLSATPGEPGSIRVAVRGRVRTAGTVVGCPRGHQRGRADGGLLDHQLWDWCPDYDEYPMKSPFVLSTQFGPLTLFPTRLFFHLR